MVSSNIRLNLTKPKNGLLVYSELDNAANLKLYTDFMRSMLTKREHDSIVYTFPQYAFGVATIEACILQDIEVVAVVGSRKWKPHNSLSANTWRKNMSWFRINIDKKASRNLMAVVESTSRRVTATWYSEQRLRNRLHSTIVYNIGNDLNDFQKFGRIIDDIL